jgi:hypothetical protein
VIGYAPRKTGRCICCDAAMMPQASAVLPVMFRYRPGWIFALGTMYEVGKSSVVSPKA